MILAPDDARHGTYTGYQNHRCRCGACRAAHTSYLRDARERRKYRLVADPTLAPHGVWTTYTNWVCRCELCCDAYRIYDRQRKERARKGTARLRGRPSVNGARDNVIRDMRSEGFAVSMIAEMFGISETRVRQVLRVAS